ncbi:MAG: hypothetical protein HY675_02205 [Chloroflexi bacterium]|nr:hypothetical protein [Chloroflexota bacterium]
MAYRYTPYIWVLLASAAITGALGVYAWRHRALPAASQFAVLMVIAVTWSLGNTLEMTGVELPTKIFWANVQYLAYSASPVGWLALGVQFSGRPTWLTRNRRLWGTNSRCFRWINGGLRVSRLPPRLAAAR